MNCVQSGKPQCTCWAECGIICNDEFAAAEAADKARVDDAYQSAVEVLRQNGEAYDRELYRELAEELEFQLVWLVERGVRFSSVAHRERSTGGEEAA